MSQPQILKFYKRNGLSTDLGMCGDYDSVIGMNKENSIKFLKDNSAKQHYPFRRGHPLWGNRYADDNTGLANNINPVITGEFKRSF